MNRAGNVILSVFAVAMLAACTEETHVPRAPATESQVLPGTWRAVVKIPGGDLPFQIELQRTERSGWMAYYVNGEERVRVREVEIGEDSVNLFMPAFNSRIVVDLQDGALVGEMTVIKTHADPHVMPFRAEHDQHYRFFEMLRPPEINVSGRWAVTFVDDEGNETPAVGIFRQQGAHVTGTFLTPLSDYRYLAGEVNGKQLFLSAFDGSHVFLFKAEMNEKGKLLVDFWSALKWQESWTASLDPDAELPDPENLTFLNEGFDRFAFTFPDLDGNPVSLTDRQFNNKVIIITLAGSWCPNCHDEAAFMAPWYLQNRERGVEVVALMFEHYGDFKMAAQQTREFRKKFGIEYTTLIAGVSDKEEAGKVLPMLNAVIAFPTTLFIDAQGNVRRIHTGFNGPGTGERFEVFKRDFTSYVDTLVAERVAQDTS